LLLSSLHIELFPKGRPKIFISLFWARVLVAGHFARQPTALRRASHFLARRITACSALLYHVAIADFSAPEIAQAIRSILSNQPDATVLLDAVTGLKLMAALA
jgi:hypothetical protein